MNKQAVERRKRVLALHRMGRSYAAIADELGVSKSRISQLVRQARRIEEERALVKRAKEIKREWLDDGWDGTEEDGSRYFAKYLRTVILRLRSEIEEYEAELAEMGELP